MWSSLQGRVSNRLARHFRAAPHRLPARAPMVSFTFDDAPDSAAGEGAELLEKHGGRGTFYLSGSLIDQPSDHWQGLSNDAIVRLHRAGHEIACHTFSHQSAVDLDEAAMEREIERNRDHFRSIDSSIMLENFAYPYGLASVWRKPQLARAYRSARGILPGVNHGVIDLQFLRASPLIDRDIDTTGIDRYFDEAVASGGWLILYGHDVADRPSPYGCTPHLMCHALKAAEKRSVPIVTVAEALRRIGA
ncbi:polysaccharide deacetylase family protein [Bradyrhizobium sp. 180]|uniref:polysaccharide deacetylase family protein n=1 Tax=unclassified Bradyrhizobium TaxID=2631580 RepID=UPI001FF99A45|nr:polysaccharide deacetylase family protein [Bradyrhizobium sp. CW12]MCK1492886.1 polysaccharide deacetylase family protein [Bradyrhizobium sp. 180]MCK1529706.1 polysaccharide deacetylase family protein [Bradyrhizobium sp. 182]MCK1593773.1 polysaccharide deacetylase family protein [Bradyrhizobium sp. 164]MCK1617042.1 polysaccharide deacetylase family protein [Bradyrhizobium sp. 159]MCK1646078.1 polysaccharide deacetylase family protein [Bradyrhizobium sp. 154]MCK1665164.1 polysaccharide deac